MQIIEWNSAIQKSLNNDDLYHSLPNLNPNHQHRQQTSIEEEGYNSSSTRKRREDNSFLLFVATGMICATVGVTIGFILAKNR